MAATAVASMLRRWLARKGADMPVSQSYLDGLLVELRYCRESRNPRGRQVEDELRRHGVEVPPDPAAEDTVQVIPLDYAVPPRRGPGRPKGR